MGPGLQGAQGPTGPLLTHSLPPAKQGIPPTSGEAVLTDTFRNISKRLNPTPKKQHKSKGVGRLSVNNFSGFLQLINIKSNSSSSDHKSAAESRGFISFGLNAETPQASSAISSTVDTGSTSHIMKNMNY